METEYEMCVDFDTLCLIEEKLETIQKNLLFAIDEMKGSLQNSQSFLSGRQFEKAKSVTSHSIVIVNKTSDNIRNAIHYIEELKSALEEYNNYKYWGDV